MKYLFKMCRRGTNIRTTNNVVVPCRIKSVKFYVKRALTEGGWKKRTGIEHGVNHAKTTFVCGSKTNPPSMAKIPFILYVIGVNMSNAYTKVYPQLSKWIISFLSRFASLLQLFKVWWEIKCVSQQCLLHIFFNVLNQHHFSSLTFFEDMRN